MTQIDIIYMMPFQDDKAREMAKELEPVAFKVSQHTEPRSMENYLKKREQIQDAEFEGGLKVWRTLLADDLGEGVLSNIKLHFDPIKNVRGIVLQIPTPLGSSTGEEFVFYAWVKLARETNIFCAGYELLPLSTRWNLIPSMVDGIITSSDISRSSLSDPTSGVGGQIWQLPRNEGKIFTPSVTGMWHHGMETAYIVRSKYDIQPDMIILYLPHNVAMSYEYRRLIEEMKEFAPRIHLMFTIGKDQIRGTHTHEEIIKTMGHDVLHLFHSFSFHDLNAGWEMTAANAVIACAHCFSTRVAEANGIPSCVYDDFVPPIQSGMVTITNDYDILRQFIRALIEEQEQVTSMAEILHDIVRNKYPKIEVD